MNVADPTKSLNWESDRAVWLSLSPDWDSVTQHSKTLSSSFWSELEISFTVSTLGMILCVLISYQYVLCMAKIISPYLRGKSLLELWVTTSLPNWQPPLIFVWFISNFLCMCSNNMASAHLILKEIRQRLRVAVSQEEKRHPMRYLSYLPLAPGTFN